MLRCDLDQQNQPGIAAINIGGTTINHFGRFQLGEYYSDFNNMMSEDTRKKIKSMDALLIDEISMLDGHLFDVLECMITIIRCYDDVKDRVNKLTTDDNVIMSENMLRMRWDMSENGFADAPPFGGLQLIVVGDFYQLPPIPNKVDEAMEIGGELETSGKYDLKVGRQGCYAFESNAWQNSSFQTVELTEIHRQDGSDGLFEFLNGMRVGEPDLKAKHASTLASLQAPLPQRGDNIIPTELHSKNYMVNKINSDELHKLPDNIHEFAAHDEVELDEQYKQNILNLNGEPGVKRAMKELNEYAQEHYFARDCRVSHNIDLKKDAQVMLLWNLEFKSKLANGSRGVVKGFFPAKGYLSLINDEINERQDEMPGSDNREDEPEPLPIADGKSGDSHALITPSKMSQEETSPSIATQKKSDSEKKKITRFDFSDVNPEFVKEIKSHVANMGPVVITRELEHVSKVVEVLEIKEFPYVHFSNGKRDIRPQPFEKEYKKVGTATRWQIPLTLAWAISIHKSQGMTIEWLQVNLMDCFAIGQCYVACSRGKCLNSMSVRNFKPTEVKISEKVKTFYNNVKSGKPYSGKTWLDTIEEFDKVAKRDIKKLRTMKQHYNNTKPCSKCGKMCVVSQIKTNRNGNAGKFFIACPDNWNGNGHTWELVNTLPLSNTSTASGRTNTKDGTQTNRNNQKFKLLTPGVDGSIEGRLQDIRFVATGLFPELGGGEGLKIGRDNLKVMIESFGGKVTGSIR